MLPSLVFINGSDKEELSSALEYIEKTEALYLNAGEVLEILKKKGAPQLVGIQIISLLINIIWKNADKDVIFLNDFPTLPEEFVLLQDKTRGFSLFADCLKP